MENEKKFLARGGKKGRVRILFVNLSSHGIYYFGSEKNLLD